MVANLSASTTVKGFIIKQPVPIFEGDIVNKKLKLFDHEKKAIALWATTFPNGTKVDITIRKHKEKRSNDQNRYYFGVVIPILADYFGHDSVESMHEDLKLEFNPVPSKIDTTKIIGGSTTKLSTEEFFSKEDSYVNRICRWSAEKYGLYIPPPKKAEKG